MPLTSPERGALLERIDFDAGAMEGLHEALGTVEDHAANAMRVLRNIERGLEGRGAAIGDVKADSGATAARIAPTAGVLRRIAAVLRAYGEAAAQHAGAANRLIDDVERADRTVDDALAELRVARSRRAALSEDGLSEGALDAAMRRADAAVEAAEEDLTGARRALADRWEAWEAQYGAWDDAYGAALAALSSVDAAPVSASLRAAIEALAHADSPASVAAAWLELTDDERSALLASRPGLIGNLEGIPYPVRFQANRTVLAETVATGPHGDPLDGQLALLGVELSADFGGELLLFHPFEQSQATAAVVYGAPRTARGEAMDPFVGATNVNLLVGGMLSGLGDLEAWGQSARDLNRYSEAYGGPGTGSVTIAWYGYDSPNLATEHGMGSAIEGAARMSSTLLGLAAEAPGSVTTSVIGHSYGSTTAFLAVGGSPVDLAVDRLIAVGSAGVPDGYHAAWTGDAPMDYSGTEVYATRAPWDFIGRYGEHSSFGHGTDPEEIPGAVSFSSDGGFAPSLEGRSERVAGTPGHAAHDGGNGLWGWWEQDNGYLARDSESFRNIASIVANGEVLQ